MRLLICPQIKLLFLCSVHSQWYIKSKAENGMKVEDRGFAKEYTQEVATNDPSSSVTEEGICIPSLFLLPGHVVKSKDSSVVL